MTIASSEELIARIRAHQVTVGIIGLGYVGLPLALTFAERGFRVLGFDVDPAKVTAVNRGEGYIQHLDPARVAAAAERALLGELDGSCRTPIGGHLRIQADGSVTVTGLVARADGSFLLKHSLSGAPEDAALIGRELGMSLRADSPDDLFG